MPGFAGDRDLSRVSHAVRRLPNKIEILSIGLLMEKVLTAYGDGMSMSAGVHAHVRRTHEERVLGVLREQGALSRGQIAQAVGLSRTTLSEITGSLIRRGAIIVVDTDADRRLGSGRPAERLALDPASGQFMGIDFGHRRVRIAVADAAHEIIASGSDQYAEDASWTTRLDVAFGLTHRLTTDSGVHFGALQGIGIGVPGPYAVGLGAPADAPYRANTAGFSDARVDHAFAERFEAPVIIDNNTRLAALAEAIFDGSSVKDLLYVRLSDGVGGGLVVGGRLVSGSVGLAGELGHVTAVPDGDECRCGKNGCLETVASVPAILAACRSNGLRVETLEDLRAAVIRSHPTADFVLRGAGMALGRVLGAAAMALDPAEIVIGGEVARVAPALVQQAAARIEVELFPRATSSPLVRSAQLSDDDGALGALAALFHSSPLLAGYPEAPGSAAGTSVRPLRTSGQGATRVGAQ